MMEFLRVHSRWIAGLIAVTFLLGTLISLVTLLFQG